MRVRCCAACRCLFSALPSPVSCPFSRGPSAGRPAMMRRRLLMGRRLCKQSHGATPRGRLKLLHKSGVAVDSEHRIASHLRRSSRSSRQQHYGKCANFARTAVVPVRPRVVGAWVQVSVAGQGGNGVRGCAVSCGAGCVSAFLLPVSRSCSRGIMPAARWRCAAVLRSVLRCGGRALPQRDAATRRRVRDFPRDVTRTLLAEGPQRQRWQPKLPGRYCGGGTCSRRRPAGASQLHLESPLGNPAVRCLCDKGGG